MARIPGFSAEQRLDTGGLQRQSAPANIVGPSQDSNIAADAGMGQALMNAGSAGVRTGEKLENFTTEQKFARFQMEQDEVLTKRTQESQPGLPNLAAGFENDVVNPKSDTFLNNDVPERLRPEYAERLKTWKETAGMKAAKIEYAGRNEYFKTTLTKDAGSYAAQVDNDPNLLPEVRDQLFKQIDNTTLTSTEREALKSQHGFVIAKAAINGLVRSGRFEEARTLSTQIAGTAPDGAPPVDNTGVKGQARTAIIQEANKQGIDPQLAVMTAHLESSLNPAAAAGGDQTSKGLFGMRKAERREMGLDENASVEQQAAAGVAFIKKNMEAMKAAGIPVTPLTVYMTHFQGLGGAKKIMTAPADADLEETLDAARPGWKNKAGKGYGEVVMDANNLDDMTVGEFRNKISKRVEGGMTAAALGGLGWNERKNLVDSTETLITQKENDDKKDNREAIRKTAGMIDDDLASVTATGKTIDSPDLTEANVAKLLGQAKADEWLMKREQGRRLHAMTSDFESIPNDEINRRLGDLSPEGGKLGFANGQEMYAAAQKKAERVMKLREVDPAEAVRNDPQVKGAQEAYNPQKPSTARVLVEARYAAQERAGIPPAARSPITDREARQLAAGLEGGLPTQTRERLEGLINGLNETYGPHADAVLVSVMGTISKNKELSEMAAGMARKLARGQAPSASEGAVVDKVSDAQTASQSISGMVDGMNADATSSWSQVTKKAATEIPEFRPKQPFTKDAIQSLIMSPKDQSGAFDETYGPGAAAHIMLWQQKIFESKNKRAGANG